MEREVAEETGIRLSEHRHFVLTSGRQKWKRYVIFVVKLLDPHDSVGLKILDEQEIDDIQWVDIRTVFRMRLNRVTKDCLRRYLIDCTTTRGGERRRADYQHFGHKNCRRG